MCFGKELIGFLISPCREAQQGLLEDHHGSRQRGVEGPAAVAEERQDTAAEAQVAFKDPPKGVPPRMFGCFFGGSYLGFLMFSMGFISVLAGF